MKFTELIESLRVHGIERLPTTTIVGESIEYRFRAKGLGVPHGKKTIEATLVLDKAASFVSEDEIDRLLLRLWHGEISADELRMSIRKAS